MSGAFSRIARLWRSPMPLLSKELLEQAARRRTYVLRVVYASLLFFTFAWIMYDRLKYALRGDPFSVLGYGREIFETLIYLQFTGIFVFLPAMMSGVVTYEKERDSLSLLFLTDLGPWEILLQKYFGRLIPMFTFLLLSLPLLAIAYSFGGITSNELSAGVFLMFLCCLQVGALSIMFSAFHRTTAGAFLSSYLFGFGFYLFLALLWLLLEVTSHPLSSLIDDEHVIFAFFPPFVFADTREGPFTTTVLHSIPILASTLLFLVLGRVFLVARAFAPRKQRLLDLFRRQDRFWSRVNRLFGGIVLLKDKGDLPEDKPVAWREVTKRPLGKLNYLLRLMLLIEIPLVLLAIALISQGSVHGMHELLSLALFCLWGVSVLAVSVKSANLVAAERSSQTLEVLLTTPLRGPEIVRQKMSGVWRMILVLLIPFLTVFLVEAFLSRAWWTWPYPSNVYLGGLPCVLFSLAAVLVYLPMFAWFSNWVGLWTRTRARAITAALIGIVLWNVLPILFLVMVSPDHEPHEPLSWVFLLSPASTLIMTEAGGFDVLSTMSPWSVMTVNLLWHGFLLYILRRLCILHADRYLGRLEEKRGQEPFVGGTLTGLQAKGS